MKKNSMVKYFILGIVTGVVIFALVRKFSKPDKPIIEHEKEVTGQLQSDDLKEAESILTLRKLAAVYLDEFKEHKITKIEYEEKDGKSPYKLEGSNGDKEGEIRVSKEGVMTKVEEEKADMDLTNSFEKIAIGLDELNVLEIEEIIGLGLTHMGDKADEMKFKELELEKENGELIYDLEYYYKDGEVDLKINAKTGELISRDN